MKKLILLFAASMALNVQAAQTKETCAQVVEYAEIVMDVRQMGGDFIGSIATANGDPLFELIVTEAYNRPRYSTEDYKQKAISDFKNTIAVKCYKAIK